jgi:2-polyprenyl-3-methyl-5-hydroxy-6-metoxy-1,4-benzoquinol methylase
MDAASYDEVRDSLIDVQRVNKFLSGYRVLLKHLEPFLRNHSANRPFTILDVATGSADQPVALVDLARKLQVPIRIVAIDINNKMLKLAREETIRHPEIDLVQCDIFSLPFRENGFDLVVNSLSLHHFTREQAEMILKTMFAACKSGFIVNDLHRSRVACAAIYLLTRLLTRNRLTRHDAPASVMNAFTPAEMADMARAAGVGRFAVHRHFPYRIALVGRKNLTHETV